jgi:hypothetical protein
MTEIRFSFISYSIQPVLSSVFSEYRNNSSFHHAQQNIRKQFHKKLYDIRHAADAVMSAFAFPAVMRSAFHVCLRSAGSFGHPEQFLIPHS